MLRLLYGFALLFCLGVDVGAQASARPVRLAPLLGLDEYLPAPEDNPLTVERIALGSKLFFDPLLSSSHRVSCSSCHDPRHGFADSVALSRGATERTTRRNAPAILNRAWGTAFFWDGRAASLEEQVLQPIQDSLEMNLTIERLVSRLTADRSYTVAFAAAFPNGVTPTNIARALASYVRTIRSGDAPIDRYRGGDTTTIAADAKHGLALFRGKANCSACHVGPSFTDERFHNTGVALASGDPGRFGVTARQLDRGVFKTPTLREVARTGPYMHDGSIPTLKEVVEFYDRGGRPNPGLDPEIRALGLTADEKRDLVAFLRALSGDVTAGAAPTPVRK